MKYSLLGAYEEIEEAGLVGLLVLQSTVMHKAVLQLKKKVNNLKHFIVNFRKGMKCPLQTIFVY